MEKYIPLDALVSEIKRLDTLYHTSKDLSGDLFIQGLFCFLDTVEMKEVDEQQERMSECPFKKVGCEIYEGHILECKGTCSWVVDHLKLKQLKAPDKSTVDFFSIHSKEEVAKIDRRIMAQQKEHDAKLMDAMRKVEDFPMTD